MDAPARIKPAIHDAASLFVIDSSGSEPRVLAGRRASGHVFMAGKTVFPGGRVDRDDSRLARRYEISPPACARLLAGVRRGFTANRATAIALAAIREGYEEAGIMIGRPGIFRAPCPAWAAFEERAIQPAPDLLTPVARAITPPGQKRRFDARFFAVDARHIAWRTEAHALPTDELDDVAWMSFEELQRQPLAEITQLILSGLIRRIADGNLFDSSAPMVVHRRQPNGFQTIFV